MLKNERSVTGKKRKKKKADTVAGDVAVAESVELGTEEKAVSVSVHGHYKRITETVTKKKKNNRAKNKEKKSISRKAKGKKKEKVYLLPGQKHDPPHEAIENSLLRLFADTDAILYFSCLIVDAESFAQGDPLRIFYESLYEQRPESEMAAFWLMERGLLPQDVTNEVYAQKLKRKEQQRVEKTGTTKSVKVIKMNSVTSKSKGQKGI